MWSNDWAVLCLMVMVIVVASVTYHAIRVICEAAVDIWAPPYIYESTEEANPEPEAEKPIVICEDRIVGYRVKDFADDWILFNTLQEAKDEADSCGNRIEPLYTTGTAVGWRAGKFYDIHKAVAEQLIGEARTASYDVEVHQHPLGRDLDALIDACIPAHNVGKTRFLATLLKAYDVTVKPTVETVTVPEIPPAEEAAMEAEAEAEQKRKDEAKLPAPEHS